MGYDGTLVLEFLARTHQTSLLTDREKHLIGLAVTMTRGCQVCTRGRIEKARAAGIGDDVLNALVGCRCPPSTPGSPRPRRGKASALPTHPWPRSAARSVPRRSPPGAENAAPQRREGERMKGSPKVGTTGEQQFVVERGHAIDFADGAMPAVLSTPWLIWFLEHAAREAVLPFLGPGENTVGTYIEVRHLAPTPVGKTVICRARVVQAEGAMIAFQLEAHDEHELIGRGLHRLRVIQIHRVTRKVLSKTNPGQMG